MAGIDRNTKRTLKVLDFAKGKTTPKSAEEWAEALFQLTNVIRLFNIEERLGSGWGKYVFDVTINELGENAEEKLRAKRSIAIKKLSSLKDEQLNALSPSLRRDVIAQRILDYEPSVRQAYKKLLLKLLATRNLRFIKLNTHSPKPISVLYSENNTTLLNFDNFYVDPMTVRLFDSKQHAMEFVSRFAVALLYCRRKGISTSDEIANDRLASAYSRKLYKLFLKGMVDENKSNMEIAELFRDYDIYGASRLLMAKEKFYITIRNLAQVMLVEFRPGKLHITSFIGKGKFAFDEYGKEKILESTSRDRHAGALYLSGVASIFDYLINNFSLDSVYLKHDFSPASMEDNPWAKKLPMQISAECTADYEKIEIGNNSLIGLKNVAIGFSSGDFIELAKPAEDFSVDPVHHSLFYSTNIMLYPKSGMMSGAFYTMPELDVMFMELRRFGKISKSAVNRANLITSKSRTGKTFEYIAKDGKSGVIANLSDIMLARPKKQRRVGKNE